MKKILRTALYIFICQAIYAQNNNINGRVTDENGNPLEDMHVILKDTDLGTTTDADGFFKLKTNEKTPKLLVSGMGFEKQEIPIEFTKNNSISVQIRLDKKHHQLEEIIVVSEQSLLENSVQKARERQREVAGGVNVVELKGIKTRRSFTLKDALELQPGVIIQEFFGGNDQPRLNIRGSGIQSNPQMRGVNLLQDGISTNFSDGSYIIGVLEPRAANYIEVFRGSNALKYGSATLGGAINLTSNTGYNASSPFEVKLERGSFGYVGGGISSGTVFGKNDLYVSTSYNKSDGFRKQNAGSRLNTTLNFGRKFNEKLESRLYLTYTDLRIELPGPLTQAQIDQDPTQIALGVNIKIKPPVLGPNMVRDFPQRNAQMLRVANKSIYKFDANNSLTFALRYQNAKDVFTYPITVGVRESLSNDFGAILEFRNTSEKNRFDIGINSSMGKIDRSYFVNMKGEKGKKYAANDLISNNIVLYLEDVYKITPKLSSVAGLQLSYNVRNNKDNFQTPTQRPFYNFAKKNSGTFSSPDSTLEQSYLGINPKLGFIYDISNSQQLFFNVGKSYEPPTFDELINVSKGTPNKSPEVFKSVKIDAQTATTLEMGSRGKYKRLRWDMSLYNSWVTNEILTTTDIFSISGITRNSPDQTIHMGLELGFGVTLLKNIFSSESDEFNLNGVYNYSDFYFDEGIYKGKQIAGIPQHYINANLEYKHPIGFFTAVNTEWLPNDTPTDHQNTVYQKAYQLLGFRVGYNKPKWSLFVEGKNITDEKYASGYLIRDIVPNPKPKALTPANVTTFVPGVGANFSLGFNYRF